jgi:hypothetical protein
MIVAGGNSILTFYARVLCPVLAGGCERSGFVF